MKKRVVFLITAAVLSLSFIFSACSNKVSDENDISAFSYPDDFEWEGTYMDEEEGMAVLTVTKNGKKYDCTIDIPDKDVTHIDSYEFTAVEDEAGLSYENGVCISYDLPDYEDEDAALITDEVYTDGTGSLYYVDGYVYWLDDKNDAGATYMFAKQDEVEDESKESGDAGVEK